jgi:4-aminobutyrate aminotransferase-like enzyme
MAIQLARMFTGHYEVVALRHGSADARTLAQGLTGHAPWRKSQPGTFGVVHAINPYCYRCPFGLKYPDCGVACANDVENLIQTTTSGKIAAFIAEPIQGVGGFITAPPEYFKIVFNIIKKYDGVFISDEVQTAWGRTGKKWFGIEHWEVTPGHHHEREGLGERRAGWSDHDTGGDCGELPGIANLDVWRESGYVCGGASDDRRDGRR